MKPIFRKALVFFMLFTWNQTAYAFITLTCPEDAAALTPAPLQEEWAVEWWKPRHEAKLTEEGRETADVLFLGDSITHGWETTGKAVADEYFSGFLIYNIGFSGDRTENVLWRFNHGEIDGINPELAVLMIGTNNTGHRQDSPDCTARGDTPGDELRQINSKINQQIEKLADGERVHFMNINSVFLDDDGNLSDEIMPDKLHPNEYGYELWAKAMLPAIRKHLSR